MATITIIIPKNLIGKGELVAIPKEELGRLKNKAEQSVAEKDILRWSREARQLKRAGKLPILRRRKII